LKVCWEIVASPVGPIGLAAGERGLCRVVFDCSPESFASELESLGLNPTRGGEPIRDGVEQLQRYLAGEMMDLSARVDFIGGTAFQRAVWRAMRNICYGRTCSYAWLAAQIGSPRAARAVGQACSANPVAIFCPCHRVIRTDGSLGGFSAGLEFKRFLLRLEAKWLDTEYEN